MIKRTITKTITWRLTGTTSTFVISWLVTGDVAIAGTVMWIHALVNTGLYFIHEHVWNKIK